MRAPLYLCLSVWHLILFCLTRRDCRRVPLPELGRPVLAILRAGEWPLGEQQAQIAGQREATKQNAH